MAHGHEQTVHLLASIKDKPIEGADLPQTNIKMSPFMAMYSYEAPSFFDILFGDCEVHRTKDHL